MDRGGMFFFIFLSVKKVTLINVCVYHLEGNLDTTCVPYKVFHTAAVGVSGHACQLENYEYYECYFKGA
jgi:hypothetical protein